MEHKERRCILSAFENLPEKPPRTKCELVVIFSRACILQWYSLTRPSCCRSCPCMGRGRSRNGVVSTPCGQVSSRPDAMDYLNVCPGVRPVASGSSLAALAPNEDAVGQVSQWFDPHRIRTEIRTESRGGRQEEAKGVLYHSWMMIQ